MYKTRAWQVKLVLFFFLFTLFFSSQDTAHADWYDEHHKAVSNTVGIITGTILAFAVANAVCLPVGVAVCVGAAAGVLGGLLLRSFNELVYKEESKKQAEREPIEKKIKIKDVNDVQNLDLAQLQARYESAQIKYQRAVTFGNRKNIAKLAEDARQAKKAFEEAYKAYQISGQH